MFINKTFLGYMTLKYYIVKSSRNLIIVKFFGLRRLI